MNSGLITGGQILSKRQTVFFTSVDPMNKEQKDPNIIDLKKHQDTVYRVDMKLAQQKGLMFYQKTIERNHPLRYTPSLLYTESCSDGNWRIIYEKVFASPRPPPKISFKDRCMKEFGSEVAGGGKNSRQTQPKTKKSNCKKR